MVLEIVHGCGVNEVTATFCYNGVHSVMVVVAKMIEIFLLGNILDIYDMILGKKSYPILKYQKEKNNSMNRKKNKTRRTPHPEIMPPFKHVYTHTA